MFRNLIKEKQILQGYINTVSQNIILKAFMPGTTMVLKSITIPVSLGNTINNTPKRIDTRTNIIFNEAVSMKNEPRDNRKSWEYKDKARFGIENCPVGEKKRMYK